MACSLERRNRRRIKIARIESLCHFLNFDRASLRWRRHPQVVASFSRWRPPSIRRHYRSRWRRWRWRPSKNSGCQPGRGEGGTCQFLCGFITRLAGGGNLLKPALSKTGSRSLTLCPVPIDASSIHLQWRNT